MGGLNYGISTRFSGLEIRFEYKNVLETRSYSRLNSRHPNFR